MDGSVHVGSVTSGPGSANYESTGTGHIDLKRLRMTQDVLLVAPELETETKSGIVLPDVGDAQKIRRGVVVKVGPGRHNGAKFVPTTIKEGDVVYFGKYQSAGEPIQLNGKRYLLFREGDLFASEAEHA